MQMKNINSQISFFSLLIVTSILFSSCKKEEINSNTAPTSVTDIDGNEYPVVQICGKYWMAENLRTTRYNDSSIIPTGLTNTAWGSTTSGAYAVYNDIATNNNIYGKLYNWFAANNSQLAPKGWHVATEAELAELSTCNGGSSVAGGKLKSTSTLWTATNVGATNSTGFNALPSGWRANGGSYALLGDATYFWGSNERNSTQGEHMVLSNDFASTRYNGATKQSGYSVRCVKNY